MLLPPSLELVSEHHIGLSETARDVALADRHVEQHVAAVRLVNQRRARGHGSARVDGRRQILVGHRDQLRALRRSSLALGDDQRDLVALEAHLLATQHRLVALDQPMGVERHIGGRQHRKHPRCRQRRAAIDRRDARVRAVREHHLEMQHARANQVAGIARRAGDLAECIGPRQRRPDYCCHRFSLLTVEDRG